MNNPPYRAPGSNTDPEESPPDFQSPGAWSTPRRIATVVFGNLTLAIVAFGIDLSRNWVLGQLALFATVSMGTSAALVLGPMLERWCARRDAREVARLMGRD